MSAVILPPIKWKESPNQSARSHWTPSAVTAVCAHRWANPPQTTKAGALSTYHGVVDFLCKPSTQAAAHVVYGGSLVGEATQLVPWEQGAWACEAFNGCTDNIEFADAIWSGDDPEGFKVAARIVAFRCHVRGIPAVWTKDPAKHPGIIRHYDLGAAGGGHTDPTTNDNLWESFVVACADELKRGGFRATWGRN